MTNKYLVAESYKTYEQVGEPKEINGKAYITVKQPCPRCGGQGYLTYYGHVDNGTCFKCGGRQFFFKDVRIYTEKQLASMNKAKEATRERRQRERKVKYDNAHAEWPQKNGFNDKNTTFIFLIGNTYDIKDELKAAGYKFNRELGWHGAAPYEKDGYVQAEVSFDDVYEFLPFAWVPDFIGEDMIKDMKEEAVVQNSSSQYMGEIKERLRNMDVILENKLPCKGIYADWIYKFRTEDGNLCCWFTSKDMNYDLGAKLSLTGTVTKHDNYNGECETFLNRCIVKERA